MTPPSQQHKPNMPQQKPSANTQPTDVTSNAYLLPDELGKLIPPYKRSTSLQDFFKHAQKFEGDLNLPTLK
eukprot:CAMPEP_0196155596 /NCGR_PEP_ID=MMETSP0910-20130528/40924_1 /TAXON_ID=49265 /ORGANISM="Thalassiosira rotula, Strain GSO102" /LENGTH=70 /DNA_ID=CAMNT_0041419849 /DNA_START=132 /DNA_END=345 /DNA_ORIENTATION=-